MSDLSPTPQFEEEIHGAVAVPLANEQFVKSLHTCLIHQAASQRKVNRSFFLRPAWVNVFIITILAVSILVIGQYRVLAAVRGLLGYIPGVGIVNQSASIRLLAELVSVTRDGITVTVISATLTRDETQIAYRIFGVPGSAYPDAAVEFTLDAGANPQWLFLHVPGRPKSIQCQRANRGIYSQRRR